MTKGEKKKGDGGNREKRKKGGGKGVKKRWKERERRGKEGK